MADKTRKMRSSSKPVDSDPAQRPYVVLARKYRPTGFGDLIGQDALVVTLKNAFSAGRIAQAYMLSGVRGVGKTTTARILARALNFAKDGAPDVPTTELPMVPSEFGLHCAEIMESRHPDVIEMDAASNTGVDNIREIIESARYKPLIARYKVFIIDEVHMLSKGAFNALLKTLEEPPEHVKFIFATTEIRRVPVTVLSRCQRFDLRRVEVDELIKHFQMIVEREGAKAEDDALGIIARAAEGSVRDGLSILDQAIAFQQGDVRQAGVRMMLGLADRGRIFDLLEHILSGRVQDVLLNFKALHTDGCEPARVLSDLGEVVHLVTRVKAVGAEAGFEGLPSEDQRRAIALSESVSIPLLARAWQMLLKGITETSSAAVPLAAAEMVLIRMAYTADLPAPDELIKLLGGGSVARGNGARPDSGAAGKQTTDAIALDQNGSGASGSSIPTAGANQTRSEIMPEGGGGARTATAVSGCAANAAAIDVLPESDVELSEPREHRISPVSSAGRPAPASFEDVLALVGARRDARLKVHLEEHVSLVKFDGKTNAIDLHLLAGAPAEIANELREKLVDWTGMRWIVMLSNTPGDPPVAQVRREILEAEIERLKSEPVVKAALEVFPDAKIVGVTALDSDEPDLDDKSGAG